MIRTSVCIFSYYISCNHHIRALNQHGMRFYSLGFLFSAGLGSVKLYFVIFSFSSLLLHSKKEGFFSLYFFYFFIFLIVGYSYGACFPFYFISLGFRLAIASYLKDLELLHSVNFLLSFISYLLV